MIPVDCYMPKVSCVTYSFKEEGVGSIGQGPIQILGPVL